MIHARDDQRQSGTIAKFATSVRKTTPPRLIASSIALRFTSSPVVNVSETGSTTGTIFYSVI